MPNKLSQKLTYIILLMLLTYSPISKLIAQENDLPYIHYFDRLNGRLIIERVDGSDSRAFDNVGNGTPDWSPSGQWMIIGNLDILSTDGLQRVHNPQRETSFSHFARWAPNDDILLLVGTNYREGTIHAQVYDVDREVIINETTVQYWGIDPPYDLELHWTSDGETAFIFWSNHLITLDRGGYSEVKINVVRNRFSSPFVFSGGRLLHRYFVEDFRDGIIIQDLETARTLEIGDSSGWPSAPVVVRWSPTLDHALVYARTCSEEDCEGSLRLIDWLAGEIEVITPTVYIEPDFNNNECFYSHTCRELWSPNGNFAVITDEDDVVYLVDTTRSQTREIATNVQYRWTPDNKLVIPDEDRLLLYNPETDSDIEIPLPDNMSYPEFYLSPDGQLIGLPTNPATIIDLSGSIIAQSTRHSHSTNSISTPNYGYTWHPDGEWVMANYNIFFAGGGVGPSASVLFDLNNTIRRELPTSGNAGFVPERVLPHLAVGQATSVKKEPVITLMQSGNVTGIGWHPTNPHQLVTYASSDGFTFWSLESNVPQIIDQITTPTINIPLSLHHGIPLFWLPERNIVAVYNQGILYEIETGTGNFVQLPDISYPMLVSEEDGLYIQYTQSEDVVPIDLNNIQRFYPQILTSNQAAFIVVAGDEANTATYYIDALTGETTSLDAETYYSADARNGIAVLGSVYNCCVTVINTNTGNKIDEFFATAHALGLSADGQFLATTSDGMTMIWDMSEYYLDER